jgi:hypothetical protein
MKMKKVVICLLTILLVFQTLNLSAISAMEKEKGYLIGLKNNTNVDTFIKKHQLNSKILKKMKNNLLVSYLKNNEALEIQSSSDVIFIEEDKPVEITSVGKINKEDKQVKKMKKNQETLPWGMKSIGVDIALDSKEDGKQIKIAVLDTGISNHEDLKVAGGVSFIEGSTSYYDDNGHGTHVAGTIAALNNNKGVVGSAAKSNIYAVKVLNNNGSGSISQVIQGIDWAIENNMNIISLSLGTLENSTALYESVKRAFNSGLLIVAAAGNRGKGSEDRLLYPANYPEVLSVGATDLNNKRASFSSTGLFLDIVAPGVDILSTTNDGDYGTLSGTSMATPHVTGAAAVVWSKDKKLTNGKIMEILKKTSTPLGDVSEYGHGFLNLAKALGITNDSIIPPITGEDHEPVFPDKPFDIYQYDQNIRKLSNELDDLRYHAEQAGNHELAKEIGKKYNDLIIRNHALHSIPNDHEALQKENPESLTLMNEYFGTDYSNFYAIQKEYEELINSYTSIVQSLTNQEINIAAYDYKGNYATITQGESATVSLKLAAHKDFVDIRVINDQNNVIESTTRSDQKAGIDIPYTFRTSLSTPVGNYIIKYTYSNSNTTDSFTISVVEKKPDAPFNLKAVPTLNSINLSWDASRATSYKVRIGQTEYSTTNKSYNFTGLYPKTGYELSVAAVNSGGESSFTSIPASTLSDIPSIPSNLTYVPTSNSIKLKWNGDTRATKYVINKGGVEIGTSITDEFEATGLLPSTQYSFSVAAYNSLGETNGFSLPIEATTLSSILPVPNQPNSFESTANYNEMYIIWDRVDYASTYSVSINGKTYTTAERFYRFYDLTSDTTYKIGVAASNATGTSDYTFKDVTTLAVKPPQNVDIKPTDKNININWTAVENANYYLLKLNNGTTITTDKLTYRFDNLTPGTKYKIELAVNTINGTSKYQIFEVSTYPSAKSILVNNPIDISLSPGEFEIYKFTASTSDEYKFFTGPYAGIGSVNDTVLEVYADPQN